jgi:hypothetical protein
MRIIDKNTDFYDYYQNIYKDDTFVFDRRDSFLLTKEMLCSYLYISKYYSWISRQYKYNPFYFVLLQICNTFWLFVIEVIEIDNYDKVKKYNIELLCQWKNYSKLRKLCELSIIDFYHYIRDDKDNIYGNINTFINDVNINNYKLKKIINEQTIYNGNEKIKKHIPLLKACGIANCIDAHDVYLAFEEYFSLEKSSMERREPIGTTDIDKIESHGFDKKISFRGK